jgi:HD superfamily phosphohydrolase YqeK
MKEHKFKTEISDFDSCVSKRLITGKFTKKRRKLVQRAVRNFNRNWKAPYGFSPKGYAYTCGCVHDCCGCLIWKQMNIEFKKWGNNHVAVLTIEEVYNY